jgi:hypothetical protein
MNLIGVIAAISLTVGTLLIMTSTTFIQRLSQLVRGKVVDIHSNLPLIGALIKLLMPT